MQKIKTALLSYGMSGKVFHAPFITFHEGFELVGAWERSNKLIQQDYPQVKSFPSLEAVLEEPSIELVIVNTPTSTHYDYTKRVLLAGKHVLVEKAFTTTLDEAEELGALAKEKGLKLTVFQNRRWDSDFKTVQKIVSEGNLGEIVEAEFHFDRYNPELSPKGHKEIISPGAGILKDLGPHIIDQMLCLFGMPEAVFADIRITREQSVVDDYFDILLYYPKFRARLKAGYFVRETNPSYIVHGKLGSFLKSRGDVQEDQLKLGNKPNFSTWGTEAAGQEGLLHTLIDGKVVREKVATLQGNYYAIFDGVYRAIVNNETEPVSAQDGSNVMKVIELAIESSVKRQAMPV